MKTSEENKSENEDQRESGNTQGEKKRKTGPKPIVMENGPFTGQESTDTQWTVPKISLLAVGLLLVLVNVGEVAIALVTMSKCQTKGETLASKLIFVFYVAVHLSKKP